MKHKKHTAEGLAWSKHTRSLCLTEEFILEFDLESYLCVSLNVPHSLPPSFPVEGGDIDYQWKIHSLVNVLRLAFYTVCRIQSITNVIILYIAFSMNKKWGDGILFSAVAYHEGLATECRF